MLVKDIEFTLKDGRKAVLRSPGDEDIQGVLDYLYVSSGETDFILRYPEECKKYTPEGEKALFDRMRTAENETMLEKLHAGEFDLLNKVVRADAVKEAQQMAKSSNTMT